MSGKLSHKDLVNIGIKLYIELGGGNVREEEQEEGEDE